MRRRLASGASATWNVEVQVWKADRRCRAGRRLVRRARTHNMTVTAGLGLLRDLVLGTVSGGITRFGWGTGSAAVAATDTGLGNEVQRDVVAQRSATTPTSATFKHFLTSAVSNGSTIREIGLFDDAGTLYARAVLTTPIVKTSSISVTFIWVLSWSDN